VLYASSHKPTLTGGFCVFTDSIKMLDFDFYRCDNNFIKLRAAPEGSLKMEPRLYEVKIGKRKGIRYLMDADQVEKFERFGHAFIFPENQLGSQAFNEPKSLQTPAGGYVSGRKVNLHDISEQYELLPSKVVGGFVVLNNA